jgi:hypothetical protein
MEVAEGRWPFHLPLRAVESIVKNGLHPLRKPSMLGLKQQKNEKIGSVTLKDRDFREIPRKIAAP